MRGSKVAVTLGMLLAGALTGCVAPQGEPLPVSRQTAWPALREVMRSRTIVERENERQGEIVGTTVPLTVMGPRPGLGGGVLGLRAPQVQRRHVQASLFRTDDTCRLSVTVWVQRQSAAGSETVARVERDPMESDRGGPPPLARPAWVYLWRDHLLEAEIIAAVQGRLNQETHRS
jgi:hypothetical protein